MIADRWTFDRPRVTIEQCSPDSNIHRVPGTVEAVVAEVLGDAPWSARWWYPTVSGTPGVQSGDKSVYGRITVTVPQSVDREALLLRLTAAVRNATKGPAPDVEVLQRGRRAGEEMGMEGVETNAGIHR